MMYVSTAIDFLQRVELGIVARRLELISNCHRQEIVDYRCALCELTQILDIS